MSQGITFYFDWEVKLMETLQSVMGDFAVSVASFFTLFGEELMLVAVVAFLYWSYDKKIAERIIMNLMFAVTWAPMIKNLVFRRRPYFDNPGIKCLKPVDADADIYDIDAQGFSFPSGHSFSAATCYPGLAVYIKRNWAKIIGIVLPILVGISRFCLGVHYPTDVIVGLLIGALISVITPRLYDKFFEKDWFILVLFLTSVPGAFFCKTTDYFSGFGLMVGVTGAIIFERHFVNFEKTNKPLYMTLRTVVGLGVFLLFAQGLKLILPANYLTRVIRYAVGSFIAMGVYPMVFKKFEKNNIQKGAEPENI